MRQWFCWAGAPRRRILKGSCEQCLTWSSGADCVWSQRFTSCGVGGWRGRSKCRSMMQCQLGLWDSLPLRPSPHGSPTEHANPWVRQLFADVLSLQFFESVASSIALGTVSHARIRVCVGSSRRRGRSICFQVHPRPNRRDRPGSQGTLLVQDGAVAAVGSTVRKPKPKQKNKGLGVGGDSNDHGLVSLVHSLEARLRAVEATTCSVVLVPRESSAPFKGHEGGWQEVRAAGVSQRPARARPGQPSPPCVHGPPVRARRVGASAGRRPSSSELRRGRQNVAGAGHRAPDAGGNGRAGHDVSCGGLSRPAAAGETGTRPVCHERDHGSVVASA